MKREIKNLRDLAKWLKQNGTQKPCAKRDPNAEAWTVAEYWAMRKAEEEAKNNKNRNGEPSQ